VTIDELLTLIGGIAASARTTPGNPLLLAAVVCDGLRTTEGGARARCGATGRRSR
jgi:hypothetical protein